MFDIKATFCWWCGNPADSREHIFKKTDLKRVYKNAFSNKDALPLFTNGPNKIFKVQGPDSQAVKFRANLCKGCNNARSSSFDRAYDSFMTKISPLFEEILIKKEIDLKLVYGNSWEKEYINLIKYYVKHIGCRLANESTQVPNNLLKFLNDEDELKDVKLQFEVRPLNKVVAQISLDMGVSFEVLKVGNLHTVNVVRDNVQLFISYLSWITTGWLSVNYLVEPDVNYLNITTSDSSNKLSVKVANFELPPGFDDQKNIYEKTNLIEEYDRSRSSEALRKFYFRIKEQ